MRRVVAAAVSLVVVTMNSSPAWSDNFGGGYDSPSSGQITAQATSSAGVVTAGSSAPTSISPSVDPCHYGWIPGTDLAGPDGATNGAWVYPSGGSAVCANTFAILGQLGATAFNWVPASNAPAAGPSPQQLAVQALSSTAIPGPSFQTWPPNGHGVVNWPTWVHISSGWGPVSASATAGPVTATVTATPTSMTVSSFDSSDGGSSYHPISVSCPGPGTAYNPNEPYSEQHSDCTISWAWPSANYGSASAYGTYPLTVSVTYTVSWITTGGPGGGGTLTPITRSTTVDFRVGEVEALGS